MTAAARLIKLFEARYQRLVAAYMGRRVLPLSRTGPVVSFTFDDAPKSAVYTGGSILEEAGAAGTYYISFELLGADSPSGIIADREDLLRAVAGGHELGCHTFDHLDPWKSDPARFENSIRKNALALSELVHGKKFAVFAYPYRAPNPATKRRVGVLFKCCRGGFQSVNVGVADFNLLRAYFLDGRVEGNLDLVKRVIDRAVNLKGWLIFATHDVSASPSRWGCSTEFFKAVVQYSRSSGAKLLTVGEACDEIQAKADLAESV